MFESVKAGRLYQLIGVQIIRQIQEGTLAAGEKLPPESDLSKMFNVSRATVREALIALEAVGYVEVRNGSGTYVRPHLLPNVPVTWDLGEEEDPGVFEQFQAREIIEPAVAAIAATVIKESEITELERIVSHMEESYRQGLDDEDGLAFHVYLAMATQNFFLANAVKEFWAMRRGRTWSTLRARLINPEARQEAIKIRRQIIDALKHRDSEAARASMNELLNVARQLYFEGLDDRVQF